METIDQEECDHPSEQREVEEHTIPQEEHDIVYDVEYCGVCGKELDSDESEREDPNEYQDNEEDR